MNLEPILFRTMRRAVAEVFSTMLQVEIAEGESGTEDCTPDANDGVVSFIGLTGAWAGTGSLTCTPVLACRICSQMLMSETLSVNEDVLDAVAELTNMIIGSVKSEIEEHLGPLGLSIPTVVFGRNFRTKSTGSTKWVVMRFRWQDEVLVVKLCMAPQSHAGANRTTVAAVAAGAHDV
jgi:chemotaxis protein CheX